MCVTRAHYRAVIRATLICSVCEIMTSEPGVSADHAAMDAYKLFNTAF